MTVSVSGLIDAPRQRVWEIITDFDKAEERISGVTDLQVLERPAEGIMGLKWQETRIMFGKAATETMWISDAVENEWYETTANNHGTTYNSRLSLKDSDGKTELTMSFSATPTTLVARLMSPLAILFTGTIRKAFQQDLNDIKKAAES